MEQIVKKAIIDFGNDSQKWDFKSNAYLFPIHLFLVLTREVAIRKGVSWASFQTNRGYIKFEDEGIPENHEALVAVTGNEHIMKLSVIVDIHPIKISDALNSHNSNCITFSVSVYPDNEIEIAFAVSVEDESADYKIMRFFSKIADIIQQEKTRVDFKENSIGKVLSL